MRASSQNAAQCIRAVTLLFSAAIVVGCASPGEGRKSGVLTVAVAGDRVLIGRARTFGTEGTFRIASLEAEPIECSGRFRYDTPPNGRARFSCSNGEQGSLRLEADGYLTGHGQGSSTLGDVQFVFGYSLAEANRRLTLPEGKVLVRQGDGILLTDRASLAAQPDQER